MCQNKKLSFSYRVALFTFADFGKLKNLKTAESTRIFNSLVESGLDVDLYGRVGRGIGIPVMSRLDLIYAKILSKLRNKSYRIILEEIYRSRVLKLVVKNKYDSVIFYPYKLCNNRIDSKIFNIGICPTMNPNFVSKKVKELGGIEYSINNDNINLECFDLIVALSQLSAKTYVNDYSGKIIVDPLIINDSTPCNQNRNVDNPMIYTCFTSKVCVAKGVKLLIEGWKKLKNAGYIKEAKLLITGDFNKSDFIINKELDLFKYNIDYIGFISNKESLFEGTDYMILPSYFEGHCRATDEAISHGVPVIVSLAAMGASTDGYNAIHIRELSVSGVFDAILESQNSDKFKTLSNNASKSIENNKYFGYVTSLEIKRKINESNT